MYRDVMIAFINEMFTVGGMSCDCLIICLAYVERFLKVSKIIYDIIKEAGDK